MTELKVVNCEELMSTPMKPIDFCVEGLISQGLFIIAGAPKVGKSWLVLDLCLSVAKGECFLERHTRQGSVFYFSLEDSYIRIQDRLYRLTDDAAPGLFFTNNAGSIGGELEKQIESFRNEHPDLRLVVIDTLQKVREEAEYTYGSDYQALTSLKNLADRLGISILLVHHTRKAKDSDPFNMISGTTGIMGCVDGSFILIRKDRESKEATLYCTGRDIESSDMELEFSECRWIVTDEVVHPEPDNFPFMIHDLMMELKHFDGTATELCEWIELMFGEEVFANKLKGKLVQHGYALRSYGVSFEYRRSHGKRSMKLDYDRSGDLSDGRKLFHESAVAVGTSSPQSLSDTATEGGDDISSGDGTG